MATQTTNDVKKLAQLIKGVRIAMLTTTDADGSLRSRPMATQEQEFDGSLWFFTREHSSKVDEVNDQQRVNVAYANPSDSRYVSVSGVASLVKDRGKMKDLWSPVLKAWFPGGIDDPELSLLRVDVEKAEYWDAPSSTVVKLVGFVKAIAGGKTYEPGEHGEVHLQ
jgi:general stress protein 26